MPFLEITYTRQLATEVGIEPTLSESKSDVLTATLLGFVPLAIFVQVFVQKRVTAYAEVFDIVPASLAHHIAFLAIAATWIASQDNRLA